MAHDEITGHDGTDHIMMVINKPILVLPFSIKEHCLSNNFYCRKNVIKKRIIIWPFFNKILSTAFKKPQINGYSISFSNYENCQLTNADRVRQSQNARKSSLPQMRTILKIDI
jgi:hypothetical protein